MTRHRHQWNPGPPRLWAFLFMSVAALAAADSIDLESILDPGTRPDASHRELDIAENPYAASYRDTYHYSQAQVQIEFAAQDDSIFRGHISASNLKPNFAYQLKLLGKPTGIWGEEGDDLSNERLGYAGRWWRVQPNPGNASDADYEAHHDDPDYIYEGYLLFDFFLSDRFGAVEQDFALDSSFHVLWWVHQRTAQPCDSPPRFLTVTGAEEDAAYAADLVPSEVGVYAEIERLCYGETELPEGHYDCRLILTEESFHQSGGPTHPLWASREGSRFRRDGGGFFYSGANCYYLMAYAADPGLRAHVDEVLEESRAMGLKVLRTWAFNDGAGQWNALQTSPGVYDEDVFVGLDYVVTRAGELGLQLILPFVNQWNDYGGMNQYVAWSATASSHDDFYTDDNCRQWYRDHVAAVVNRVNTFTGLAYKDDPTLFAWELANEPRCESDTSGDTLQEWIETMSAYIKSLDPDHMVTTGSEGFYGPGGPAHNPKSWMTWKGVDFIRNHQPATIDFACYHAWPDATHWNISYAQAMDWTADHCADAAALLGKPVIMEEFGQKRPLSVRDPWYQGWYDEVFAGASTGSATGGSHFWILYHDAYQDYDGYGVYYPDDASTVAIIETEARRMRDLSDPVPCQGNWASVMACDTLVFQLEAPADLPPGGVGDLQALPGDGEVSLSWTDPPDGDLDLVEIWRALWEDAEGVSAYPEYDDLPGHELPVMPADRDAALADPQWSLAASVPAGLEQYDDALPERGAYFYEAYARDAAAQYGTGCGDPPAATNYLLGDLTPPGGDVDVADITLLGSGYGLFEGDADYHNELDVGPTDNGSGQGIPLTDDFVGFDDLMVYSMNYESTPHPRALPMPPPCPVVLAWERRGDDRWALCLVDGGGGIRGLNLRSPDFGWTEVRAGALLERQGRFFMAESARRELDLGLALLEAGQVIRGSGELLILRAPAGGDPASLQARARDLDNRDLPVQWSVEDVSAAAWSLRAPHPNPFNAVTWMEFSLSEAATVRCEIHDLSGRRLMAPLEGVYPAGSHRVPIRLRLDAGRELPSGLYLYRFQAGPLERSGKLLLLK